MSKIQLTPAELKTQAAEMGTLEGSYESLFSSVTSTLNSMDQHWSEYLSRNFSGKIISAQKGFSEVKNMLSYGSSAARTSADSFESLDGLLGKMMNGSQSASSSSENKARADAYTAGGGGYAIKGGGSGAYGAETTGINSILKKIKQSKPSWDQLDKLMDVTGANENPYVAVTYDAFKTCVKDEGIVGELTSGEELFLSLAYDGFERGDYASGCLNFGKYAAVGGFKAMYIISDVLTGGLSTVVTKVIRKDKPIETVLSWILPRIIK